MAERRAQNKWFPADWDPKYGMANKYQGSHPLRERARKLSQGIMIIRFEMPYNVVCLKCNDFIARGVRFNAEKKCIGKYFSTKIWSFRMKCARCSHWFEVQTDPQARDYKMVDGCRRNLQGSNDEKNLFHDDDDDAGDHLLHQDSKKQSLEKQSETGTVALMSDTKQAAIRTDPFKRLEHLQEDQEFGDEEKIHLSELQVFKDRLARDDYARNSELRKHFREKKKVLKSLHDEGIKKGTVPLLAYSKEDDDMARELLHQTTTTSTTTSTTSTSTSTSTSSTATPPTAVVRLDTKKTKQSIIASSIFGPSTTTKDANSVKEKAIKKCIARGVDPKIFRLAKAGAKISNSKVGTFSLTSPAPVALKKKK